jgi:hypothetical protein
MKDTWNALCSENDPRDATEDRVEPVGETFK